MEKMIELKNIDISILLGAGDSHLKQLEKACSVTLFSRGNIVKINGKKKNVLLAKEALDEMHDAIKGQGSLTKSDVLNILALITPKGFEATSSNKRTVIHHGQKGAIKPQTEGQEAYVNKVKKHDIVFSIGPAGTGKTFLAVAFAVAALESNKVDKIILCRPAVEAGESLGFLPGDLKEKIDPYLNPLYDALRVLMPERNLKKLVEKKNIEVAPLAYMRGRTLDNAYIILDEAQNATKMQMKMFLTRLGLGSKAIITGDVTQIDLKKQSDSGLVHVLKILKEVEGIGFAMLDEQDVVRHPLVMKVIQAYGNESRK